MFGANEFVNPEFFWLFLLLPVAIAWYVWQRKNQQASLHISNISGFVKGTSWLAKIKPALFVLKLLALSCLIVAMARPRSVDVTSKVKTTKGIDIVMSIDISGSMLARDFRPNRLEALKRVASQFIKERPNDRIGLVVFAGESFTKTPVTSDKEIVLTALNDLTFDDRMQQGTAIGMGLSTAVNRVKDSKALSKVIILLTDGVNNAGFIDPRIASDMAAEFNIKTYTIGIGTNGTAPSPVAIDANGNFVYQNVPVEIDEVLLKEIADKTGGKYFRATDNKKLEEIYDEINKLEKTEIEEFKYYNYDEKFRKWVWIGGLLLLLELSLRWTVFKSFV
ncbi:MAG: VWA domain-containing protein [Flavobacteriaceae bacterium]|nr:VWA domain-containing protein [Flavobacteriaceae bacterium]MDZ4148180.1 VWA domain-containing protein [Flavobacteriaceae bacterium]